MERAEEFERQRYKVRTCMNSPDQDVEVKPPKFAGVPFRAFPGRTLPVTAKDVVPHPITHCTRVGADSLSADRPQSSPDAAMLTLVDDALQLLQSENL